MKARSSRKGFRLPSEICQSMTPNLSFSSLSRRVPRRVITNTSAPASRAARAKDKRWDQKYQSLEKERFGVIDWHISEGSLNPLRELLAFIQVLKVYRDVRPDLVHHVAIKPAVYGGGAAQFCGQIPSVNTIAGLGSAFTSGTSKARLVRPALKVLLRLALNSPRSRTVFHNDEIRQASIGAGVVRLEQTAVIRGSGVDPEEFLPHPEPEGIPMVLLASRMLWEKGVGEFVSAAKILRSQGVAARFVLVGDSDPSNPTSIPRDQLTAWAKSGWVEWWGHRSDMPRVFAQSSVVCLPSYAERSEEHTSELQSLAYLVCR